MKKIAVAIVFMTLVPGMIFAAMRKGPYLIYEDVNTEMTVHWQLDTTANCTFEWGLDTSYNAGSVNTNEYNSDHQHKHSITNLTQSTLYHYRVTEDGIYHTGTFRTSPAYDATSVKFLAFGDTRHYPADLDAVCQSMITTYTDDPDYQTFTLHAGDWVDDGDDESDWDSQFFDPYYYNTHELQANLPIQGCMGNHENTGVLFTKYFPYPFVNDRYWSFDYGPAHFTIIDQYVDYSPGSLQYTWLENDLSSTTKEWKFIMLHEPGWSAGSAKNNKDVQNYIQPLCKTYNVQFVIAGHNHYYARCEVNGITHITTGGGGAPLDNPNPSWYPFTIATAKALHHCKLNIQGDQLNFSAIDINNLEFDAFTKLVSAPKREYAYDDISVKGSVSSDYTDTHHGADIYESIQEIDSQGKQDRRYSYLNHKWTIDVKNSENLTFYLEAYKTASSDGDDFVFAYSTDDSNYTEMVTVTQTIDNDTYQIYTIPNSLSGTVYIQVKDTDRTRGNRSLDTIYIDEMFILCTGEPEPSVDVYVNDIVMIPVVGGKKYSAKATVWIKNESGQDISGATVYGEWSGAVSRSAEGVTGSDGKVTLQSPKTKNGGTFIFTVTNVDSSGTYNPDLNVETSDSITVPLE